jgi:hypothetical protein
MSRVLLVDLDETQVIAKCAAGKVGISAIETLPAGGTRLVCMSSEGAAAMTRKFKGQLIKDPVTRAAHRPVHLLW